ncbi:hypothetical protein NIES2104_45530 [Leptolyngbya sp. NIES-2104]|nr:hypothetical protein NIES2104_45530 [Leptolyngbya sp. NIES-2104]
MNTVSERSTIAHGSFPPTPSPFMLKSEIRTVQHRFSSTLTL